MKKNRILAAIVLIAAMTVAAGCGKTEGGKETSAPAETPAATQAVPEETKPAESAQAGSTEEPDFSSGLTDEGYFEGIKALDYVTLSDYVGIKIAKDKVTVSDADFEKYLEESVMPSFTETVEITDRAVEEGDVVNMDYVGMIDGVPFDRGSAEGATLEIGSGQFIPGFEDQLIGHKTGEEFDINVTFPDPYQNNPDMSGAETVFHIKLNAITAEVTPELNDEFVKEKLPEFESAEAYKAHLREDYNNGTLKNLVWNDVLDNSEVSEIPQKLIDNYVEQQVKMFKSMAASYEMKYEDLLSYYGVDDAGFREQEAEYAQSDLTSMLIAQAVCEKENIQIEEGDELEFFDRDEEDMKEIYDYYGRGYVSQILLLEKAAQFIAEHAVIE